MKIRPLLGAHFSVVGGLHRALLRGEALHCSTIQIFTKNSNQWKARGLLPEEVSQFREALARTGISPVISHGSYLVNLASPDPLLYRKSLKSMIEEIERCHLLGISSVVIHPGFHGGRGETEGLRRVSAAINIILAETKNLSVKIVFEATAGQGTGLGSRFEHFAFLFDHIKEVDRVGLCVDTCHIFAAGYDLRGQKAYERMVRNVKDSVGLGKLELFHLNDSLKELGSRVDRHGHIGEGYIGLQAFRFIMRDERFTRVPKIIETPKETTFSSGDTADRKNLALLRRLWRRGSS
ncbi:MAG: deoxyribonuclease IV [Deltaproteobacteria bacterium]|nr:deoxyribonuclease IV [Deltaproteobacteria bacterium]